MWAHWVFGCYWIVFIFPTAVHIHVRLHCLRTQAKTKQNKNTVYDMVITDWPFVVGIVFLSSLNGVAYLEYFLVCWSCNNGSYAKTVCVLLCSWLFAVKWLQFGVKCVCALQFLFLVFLSLSLSLSQFIMQYMSVCAHYLCHASCTHHLPMPCHLRSPPTYAILYCMHCYTICTPHLPMPSAPHLGHAVCTSHMPVSCFLHSLPCHSVCTPHLLVIPSALPTYLSYHLHSPPTCVVPSALPTYLCRTICTPLLPVSYHLHSPPTCHTICTPHQLVLHHSRLLSENINHITVHTHTHTHTHTHRSYVWMDLSI